MARLIKRKHGIEARRKKRFRTTQSLHAHPMPTTSWRTLVVGRNVRPGLVYHDDRGCQYASRDYRGMSRKGDCWPERS